MNYQGRRRRRRRRTGSSRTSLVMQNFNSGDWGGSTCRGVMSAIDWSAVGCLSVSPHWHSLILRWRERGGGGEGCAGKLLLAFFFVSPFFWEGSVTDLSACWPRLGPLTVKCKRQLISSLPRRDTHTSTWYNIMTHVTNSRPGPGFSSCSGSGGPELIFLDSGHQILQHLLPEHDMHTLVSLWFLKEMQINKMYKDNDS